MKLQNVILYWSPVYKKWTLDLIDENGDFIEKGSIKLTDFQAELLHKFGIEKLNDKPLKTRKIIM